MGGDDRRPGRGLPDEAISALADLVAAGYGISAALEILPRRALKPAVVQRLESEVAELQAVARNRTLPISRRPCVPTPRPGRQQRRRYARRGPASNCSGSSWAAWPCSP